MKTIKIVVILILALYSYAAAGVDFEFKVAEQDTAINKSVVVFKDNVPMQEAKTYHFFTGPLTITLYTLDKTDNGINSQIEISTLPPNIITSSRKALLKYDNKLLFEIGGKNKSVYRVEMSAHKNSSPPPKSLPDIKWAQDESFHFKYSYIKGTIADYHLPYYSAYLEKVDKFLKKWMMIKYSGKLGYTFYYDYNPDVYWDRVFPVSYDPTYKRMAVVYSNKNPTITATLLSAFLFYYDWGYSHPFLVWGIAGYFDQPDFFASQLRAKGVNIDPQNYFKSRLKWKGNPNEYMPFIASFTKFIFDGLDLDKFKKLYLSSTDITDLKSAIEESYGESYEEIKDDWLRMLDGYDAKSSDIGDYAELEYYSLHDYKRALPLYEHLHKRYPKDADNALLLARCYYDFGRYSDAARIYRQLINTFGETAQYRYLLGNALYSLGDYKSAFENYRKSVKIDSTYNYAYLKLAQMLYGDGKYRKAAENFRLSLGWAPEGDIYSEIYLGWADALRKIGKTSEADSLADLGIYFARNKLQSSPDVLLYHLLYGEALLYNNQPDSSMVQFSLLKRDENREFYIGRTYLDIGKAYDLMGKHKSARKYYRLVIKGKSAAYHKEEAKRLLK